MSAIFTVIFCIVSYFLASLFFPIREIWIYQTVFFLTPSAIFIYLFFPNKREILFRKIRSIKIVATIIALALILSVGLNLVTVLLDHFISLPDRVTQYYQDLLTANSIWGTIWQIFSLGLLPAICEETLFRGFLQNTLQIQWTSKKAVIVTSLLFAISHLNPWYFVLYFGLGLFLGWCQNRYKNLLLPILAHWINNLLAIALFHLL